MEIRDLTQDEIDAIIAKYPKARRTPVSNFLSGMSSAGSAYGANMNFHQDARDYRWDTHIKNAIKLGMEIGQGHKKVMPDGKIK